MNGTEQRLLELYNRCVPAAWRVTEEAFDGLTDGGRLFARYDGERLIGYALVRGSSLTLLCVDDRYRGKGIGSDLLNRAEDWAKSCGKSRLILGNGSDYVLQGVPDEGDTFRFFGKRGYAVTGYTCDMTLSLPAEKSAEIPDGVMFEMIPADADVLKAVESVEETWLGVYENTVEDVLLARADGKIAGFCIPSGWSRFGGRNTGSVSCVGVLAAYRGRGIGLAMVSEALRYLSDEGCARAELLHTSIPGWYGKLGFVPIHRMIMAEKLL